VTEARERKQASAGHTRLNLSVISTPRIPSGKPGKFSTSVVVVSCALHSEKGLVSVEVACCAPPKAPQRAYKRLHPHTSALRAHLTTRRDAVRHPALEHDGLQHRARCIDGSRVPRRSAAHDAHLSAQLLQSHNESDEGETMTKPLNLPHCRTPVGQCSLGVSYFGPFGCRGVTPWTLRRTGWMYRWRHRLYRRHSRPRLQLAKQRGKTTCKCVSLCTDRAPSARCVNCDTFQCLVLLVCLCRLT
jgi:hypothetical protein